MLHLVGKVDLVMVVMQVAGMACSVEYADADTVGRHLLMYNVWTLF